MSGVTFDISLDGLETALNRVQAPFEDLRPLLGAVGAHFESEATERFRTNVAPDGTRWEQSARAKAEGGRTLLHHENLRNSIHTVVGADSVEVGTNLVYAAIHQFGGKTRPHRIEPRTKKALAFGGAVVKGVNHPGSVMPARPYLGIAADDEDAMQYEFERWFGVE